jgi:hypothetical protein
VVAHSPEYIEGIGYNVKPGIAKRLHHGDLALDAHLDLHGFNVEKAKEVLIIFKRGNPNRQKSSSNCPWPGPFLSRRACSQDKS